MRGLVSGVVGCTALAMGGCTMVDSYRGLDGAPGDYVSGTSQFQRVMSGINPMSDYNSQWVLVRVVAPAGATHCWVADKSPFDPKGPKHEGRPDAKREVLLTHKAISDTATFACKTPGGEVKRSVKAMGRGQAGRRSGDRDHLALFERREGSERNVGGAAGGAGGFRLDRCDIGIDAKLERVLRRINGCVCVAVVTDDQQKLVIVQQVAESHQFTQVTPHPASPLTGNGAGTVSKILHPGKRKSESEIRAALSL